MTRFALSCDLLVDGTDRAPIENGVLLVQDDRITAVGTATEVSIPDGFERIDCSGQTVLPGLINSHSHIAWSGASFAGPAAASITEQETLPLEIKAIAAHANLLQELASGVTTVRSLGESRGMDIILRDAIDSHRLAGPRLLASGVPLRSGHGTAAFLGEVADGESELRRAVRKRVSEGVDVIKVFATNIQAGSGETAYRRGDLTEVAAYTKEELRIVAEEARRAGVPVAAHAIGGPALRWSAEVGVDSVEHANLLAEEDIEVLVKTGCVLSDPNYYLFFDEEFGFTSRKTWSQLPEWWRDKVAKTGERTRNVHRKAVQEGVTISLALDSGHGFMWRELRCMVDVIGATPLEAIAAVTRNSAALCGLPDIGTLEPGKRADVISVRGNPLANIESMKDVALVMRDGVRYDPLLRAHQEAEGLERALLEAMVGNG